MRILVVDDFPGTAEASCILLRLLGHDSRPALSGAQAIGELATFAPELVLVDLELPDISGREIARHARERGAFVALVSGHDPGEVPLQHADMFLGKPLTLDALNDAIAAAASRQAAGVG